MADLKISQLGAASGLVGTELIELVQGGVNVQSTVTAISSFAATAISAAGSYWKTAGTTTLTAANVITGSFRTTMTSFNGFTLSLEPTGSITGGALFSVGRATALTTGGNSSGILISGGVTASANGAGHSMIFANASASFATGGFTGTIWHFINVIPLTIVADTASAFLYNPNSITATNNYGIRIAPSAALNGLGTTTPNVTLDIVGGLALRATTNTIIGANQNDYAIGSGTNFRLSSSASFNITGMTGGFDGKIVIVCNVGSFNLVFTNEDALSAAANRITMSTAGSMTILPKQRFSFIYDGTTSRWLDIAIR